MAPARVKKEDLDEGPYEEYDVYITEELTPAQLLLLQFPNTNRERPYTEKCGYPPTEFRFKPATGFVELDVPIFSPLESDLQKAKAWGTAMSKMDSGTNHGFGIASGFEQGGPAPSKSAKAAKPDPDSDDDFLATQTLGGQIYQEEESKPRYMVGAFRGKELHLTPVEHLIQMRPQFHHIDAMTLYERAKSRPAVAEQARSVTAARPQNDNEDHAAAAAKRLMERAKIEPWTRLAFTDEDDKEAFDIYQQRLMLQDPEAAKLLVSPMKNTDYLDFVAPRKNGPARDPVVVSDGALEISSDEEDHEEVVMTEV